MCVRPYHMHVYILYTSSSYNVVNYSVIVAIYVYTKYMYTYNIHVYKYNIHPLECCCWFISLRGL